MKRNILWVMCFISLVSCGGGGAVASSGSSDANDTGTVVGGNTADTATFDDAVLDEATLE